MTSPANARADSPQEPARKPTPLGLSALQALAGATALSLATGYLAHRFCTSLEPLDQLGPQQALRLCAGFAVAYWFALAGWYAFYGKTATGQPQTTLAVSLASSGLGLPASVLCWGGPEVLPWSLACLGMALVPVMDLYVLDRLGLTPSQAAALRDADKGVLPLSPRFVMLAFATAVFANTWVLLIFYAADIFAWLVMAAYAIPLDVTDKLFVFVFATTTLVGSISDRFQRLFRESRPWLVTAAFVAVALPVASFFAVHCLQKYGLAVASFLCLLNAASLLRSLHRQQTEAKAEP